MREDVRSVKIVETVSVDDLLSKSSYECLLGKTRVEVLKEVLSWFDSQDEYVKILGLNFVLCNKELIDKLTLEAQTFTLVVAHRVFHIGAKKVTERVAMRNRYGSGIAHIPFIKNKESAESIYSQTFETYML